MSKRKIILATLIPLLILVGVVAFKLWAGQEILPGPAPVAVASASPSAVAVGKTVTFDGSQSKDKDIKVTWQETESGWKYNFQREDIDGKINTYSWDFGDGNSGSGTTTTHAYAQGREQPYQVTLTITADHDETASTTIEVKVGPGIRLTANPQSITSGNQTTLTATAVDNNGNTDTNFNGTIDFSVDHADRLTLSATSAQASGGVATVTATGKKVGQATVTASAAGLISDTANVTVKGKLAIDSGDNQQGAPGDTLSEPLKISVTDSQGNGIASVAIAFSITTQPSGASGTSLSVTSATTGSDGLAATTLTLGSKPGEYRVTATGTNTDPTSVIFKAKVVAKLIKVSGDNQQGAPGKALPQPLKVQVTDSQGRGVANVAIAFSIASQPQGANTSLSRYNTTTDSGGYAETTLTLGSKPGEYRVTATATNTTPASVTFTAKAIANLTKVSGDNQQGAPGSTLPNPLKIKVQDAQGNGIRGIGITFAVGTWWQTLWGARVNPTSATTDNQGYAETTLTLGNKPGTYSVVATATNTTPTSVTFGATATSGVITVTISANPTAIEPTGAGSNNTSTITVTVTENNQPKSGVSVSLTASAVNQSGGHQHNSSRPAGTFSRNSGSTGSAGTFQTTYTASKFGGQETITATAEGKTTSVTLDVRVPGLVQLTAGTGYKLTGSYGQPGVTSKHVSNHWGITTTNTALRGIARDFESTFPKEPDLSYNDISLEKGGLFDIKNNWNTDHIEHRIGKNCDLDNIDEGMGHLKELKDTIERPPYNGKVKKEVDHWHLTF